MPPYIRDLGGSPSLRLPLFYAPYILVSGGLAAEAVLKAVLEFNSPKIPHTTSL